MSEDKFCLYNVDLKYNRELANHDDNVISNSPQIGKEHRPYIGILVMINDRQYCAPITSAKPKHNTMPKNFDYLKIYDNKKLISVINFNNMIPVCQSVVQKIDITVHKNDTPQVRNNKLLLAKELDWCQNNSDAIKKNAQKTYNAVISGNTKNSNLIKRSCNFKKLEEVLDRWVDKEIQKCNDVLKENPDLKAKLNAAAKKYEKNHNLTPFDGSSTAGERHERHINVLKANPELMSEYKNAVKNHTQKQTELKPKTKHKR